MSGLIPNSLTLYLRPVEYIPPFQVNNCARWMVAHNKFSTFLHAKKWLLVMEETKPWIYKAVMANYFDATDYKPSVNSNRDVNQYRSTNSNSYGEEWHMWQ
jgi:hypothetical protein